jgi:hypothetical protein
MKALAHALTRVCDTRVGCHTPYPCVPQLGKQSTVAMKALTPPSFHEPRILCPTYTVPPVSRKPQVLASRTPT